MAKLESHKCPLCGRPVFIPGGGWQKAWADGQPTGATKDNPVVFCTDMAHWVGLLSEAVPAEAEENENGGQRLP